MIARGLERIGQIREHTGPVMSHRRSLAMHQAGRRIDVAAKNCADTLMAEAHAENRFLGTELANEFVANASVFGSSRSGRNADPLRIERFNFRDRDFIVALHEHVTTEHAKILDEIVGKRIVVIDDQEHRVIHPSRG